MSDLTVLQQAVEVYHQQLLVSEEGLGYYASHGITPRSCEEFRLGWVTTPSDEMFDIYVDKPLTPYLATTGRVLQLRYSAIEYDEARMPQAGLIASDYPLPDPHMHLFNVAHALPGLRTNRVAIVSDVKSAIRLRQLGARVVGCPGYDNWHRTWDELFSAARVDLYATKADLSAAEMRLLQMTRRGITVKLHAIGDRPIWEYLDAEELDALELPIA